MISPRRISSQNYEKCIEEEGIKNAIGSRQDDLFKEKFISIFYRRHLFPKTTINKKKFA